MNIAIGMVMLTVKTPHGLSASAFTTTSASTASKITMIARIAAEANKPAVVFNSSLTIWPSDLPSRRKEAKQDDKILHRTAEHDADQNPKRSGQIPELSRQHWSYQRTWA